jgi:acetyl-CoA C-acetyltransferase
MSQKLPPLYVVSAARTAIGSFQGAFAGLSASDLGAVAIKGALSRANLDPSKVDEVYMGNVLTAAVGQAPARQAMIKAGIPNTTPATTVGKVCGSGLQSIVFGARALALGDAGIVVTGGQESMTNAPYYLTKARDGYRMGNGQLIDGMIHDGLWDPYGNVHMGNCGELCAKEHGFTREAQDDFAKESYRRAVAAQKEGLFTREIEPVLIPQRKGDPIAMATDEEPAKGDPSKFGALRPAFDKNGTITAANASSINDGASALVLASEEAVKANGLSPIARITGWANGAHAPEWFTTAPAKAIDNVLARLGLGVNDIDLWEINEAFSVVPMVAAKLCGIDLAKVNVRGGAVSIGHPIGASGARIVTTLVHTMQDTGAKRGLATLCIGGGEAVAVVFEKV